ncbi:hypothetical protein JCM10213_001533 [Rhodosporidiobolus nylandii]
MTTELSISGVLPASLHASAVERLSSFSQTGEAFALDEEVFGRVGSDGAGPTTADTLGAAAGQFVKVKALRLRSESGGKARWSIQVNQRPEAPRTAPRAMQYGVTEFTVEEGSDPRVFVHALGFSHSIFQLHQRGVRFSRGAVLVEVFQLFETPTSAGPLDSSSYAVTASTRFSAPSTSTSSAAPGTPQPQAPGAAVSAQEARDAALASVEQVAELLKGLVDLARVD